MPFPSTRTVPAGWSKHHRAAAAGGMNAEGELRLPGTVGEYDPDTMERPFTPGALQWSGKARVQAVVGDAHAADQAGQEVTTRGYLIQLDETGDSLPDVAEGWVWTTTSCSNDPYLVGRPLVVMDVQYGSERFTRDLLADDNLG